MEEQEIINRVANSVLQVFDPQTGDVLAEFALSSDQAKEALTRLGEQKAFAFIPILGMN